MDWNRVRKMLSRVTIFMLISIILWSIFISNILEIVDVDDDSKQLDSIRLLNRRSIYEDDNVIINNELKHTFLFMQISDTHLSKHFKHLNRGTDLLRFCTEVIDIIKPKLVIHTGDITDSRTKQPMGSEQHEEEWIEYRDIINGSNVTKKTVWLDIRGNHDNFNVFDWEDKLNYYRKYSHYGKHHKRHFNYTIEHDNDSYSFIGVDACLVPGPKRPFNFLGHLTKEDIIKLNQMKHANSHSNMTFWFGHYPTSSIAVPSAGLREIMNGPYFCGHFHTIGGLVNEMYSSQPSGILELEVGDFKDNRIFRVAAVDHGLFSFTDVKLGQWPIILITNPKPALFSMPNFEPLRRIHKSTYIRVLVFSKSKISSVQFKIDDGNLITMEHVSGPLYVKQWDSSLYTRGLHWIHVEAKDQDNIRIQRQQFSLDGSKPSFTFGGRFVLRYSIRSFGFWLYTFCFLLCVAPILIFKIIGYFNNGKLIYLNSERNIFRRIIFKFYLLSSVNKISIPLLFVPIYSFCGPWFVGYFLDDHFGICFVWGIFVNGSYLPTSFTYILGALVLLLFHFPIIICLSHILYCHHHQMCKTQQISKGFFKTYIHFRHFFILFFLFCQFLFSLSYFFSYGVIAYVFGFFNTWSFVIHFILWQAAIRLTPSAFPEVLRPKLSRQDNNQSNEQDDQESAITELVRSTF